MEVLPRFQLQGIEWMLQRERDSGSGGGILADEAGLGKKIQTIMTIIKNPQHRTLIVVPYQSMNSWYTQLRDRSLNVIQLNTDDAWNSLKYESEDSKYYIINYHKLWRRKRLLEVIWDRVVFDDARVLKNPATKIYNAALQLEAKIRWLLISELPPDRTVIFNLLKVDSHHDELILRRSLYRIIGGPPKPDIYKVDLGSDLTKKTEPLYNLLDKIKKPAVIYCANLLEVDFIYSYLRSQGTDNIFVCHRDHEHWIRALNLQMAKSSDQSILIVCSKGILQELKLHMFNSIFFVISNISESQLERLIRRVVCIGQKNVVQVFIL